MSSNNNVDWATIISEQERSGKTVSEYCKERGLNYHSFKNIKSRLKVRAIATGQSSFKELTPNQKSLTIKLRNGHAIEVSPGFSESELRRVLEVVLKC